MDCMQRKSILYNLIQPQKNIVEHIRSVVVRSDGSSMDAADYFLGRGRLEYGKTPCELDSIYLAMCDKSGTTKFDSQRCGKTHEEIEIQRSFALEQLYNQIVDTGGQEGKKNMLCIHHSCTTFELIHCQLSNLFRPHFQRLGFAVLSWSNITIYGLLVETQARL